MYPQKRKQTTTLQMHSHRDTLRSRLWIC